MPTGRRPTSGTVAPPARLVLDSSCWIEFFAGTDLAEPYAVAIDRVDALIVPAITLYEVFKKLHRDLGEDQALRALALMRCGQVVDVGAGIVVDAALNGLPMADSLIYATARRHDAILWTQDAHFDGLPGVRLFARSSP